jgi:predicted CXXCH cytochrome family protein
MRGDLPLGTGRRMLCTTCHECITGTCELREKKQELCATCHNCSKGMGCILNTPHIGDDEEANVSIAERCTRCHLEGEEARVCELGKKTVNVVFSESQDPSLKEEPGRRTKLAEGMVTCLSCHDPFLTREDRLVSSNRGRFCLSCHESVSSFDHEDVRTIQECLTCHPRAVPTHKRRRPGDMKAELPLDSRGRMLCTTCHECLTGLCHLRVEKDDLCSTCHDCSSAGMPCVLQTAHLINTPGEMASAVASCTQCHDERGGGNLCNPQAMAGEAGKALGCLACHDPYSVRHSKVLPREGIIENIRKSDVCLRNFSPVTDLEASQSCPDCHRY